MKAIVYPHYGSPDVLQLKEVEKPVPKDGEILVQIQAVSANPLDWHLMRGAPFLARLAGGLRKPKEQRIGADFAGRVEAVGNNVTQFQPGDEVFGAGTGSFAEYASVPENTVALKPTKRSFEQAAAYIALLFPSLSCRGLKFCDAHVITFNEAVEIYTVPFGGNVFDLRGLGVVWLCVSGSSHTSCS